MKRIVNRKVLSTETAAEVASYYNNLSSSDFHRVEETLYRAKDGTVFLHGIGGPMTEYAEHEGNNTSGSERLIEMSVDDVMEWLERRNINITDQIESVLNTLRGDPMKKVVQDNLDMLKAHVEPDEMKDIDLINIDLDDTGGIKAWFGVSGGTQSWMRFGEPGHTVEEFDMTRETVLDMDTKAIAEEWAEKIAMFHAEYK